MLRGATIVLLSSIDWAFNRQNPQEVASAFAEADNRVLFVENTGIRRPTWRDRARLWARIVNWYQSDGGVARTPAGVDICSPVIIPLPYSRTASRINAAVLLRTIRRWIGPATDDRLVLVTFLPTPLARAVVRGLSPAVTVYYVIDRLAESSSGAEWLCAHEDALLARADLVFATSHDLLEHVSRVTSHGSLLVSGVRFGQFQRMRERGALPHPRMHGLPRPIVGFVGSVRNELDLKLVARVARSAPDLTFFMVGPITANVDDLAGVPNVHLAGAVPHEEVVQYLFGFDVGIIPYVRNSYTAHIMPFKLKEYLAAGLPVVSTSLPEIQRFVSQHGSVIAIADDAETFLAALRSAIANDHPADRMRRIDLSKQYDWGELITIMSHRIEDVLAARRRERV
jgi:glycosyltransferase involved in cell wall biosynthesis